MFLSVHLFSFSVHKCRRYAIYQFILFYIFFFISFLICLLSVYQLYLNSSFIFFFLIWFIFQYTHYILSAYWFYYLPLLHLFQLFFFHHFIWVLYINYCSKTFIFFLMRFGRSVYFFFFFHVLQTPSRFNVTELFIAFDSPSTKPSQAFIYYAYGPFFTCLPTCSSRSVMHPSIHVLCSRKIRWTLLVTVSFVGSCAWRQFVCIYVC